MDSFSDSCMVFLVGKKIDHKFCFLSRLQTLVLENSYEGSSKPKSEAQNLVVKA